MSDHVTGRGSPPTAPWLVMFTAITATTVAVTPVFLASALTLPIRAEFDFGSTELGMGVAVFFTSSSLTALTLGKVVQRLGARTAIRTGSALSCFATLGIVTLANSWLTLVACLALAGFSNGIMQPGANLALAEGVRRERQGLSFGVKQAAIPVATLTAGTAVPIVATLVGWRWAFVATSVLAATLALCVPRLAGQARSAQREPKARRRAVPARQATEKLYLPPLLFLAGAAFFGGGVGTAIAVFLVETAVAGGWTETAAGQLLMAASITSIAVRLLVGWQIDRRQDIGLPAIGVLMGIGAAGLLLIIPAQTSPTLLIVGALLGFGGGWGWPGLFHFAMVHANRQAPASASGIGLAGVFGGAVIIPLAFGVVVDRYSHQAAWVAGAVGLTIAILFLMASHRLAGRQRAP